jgi:nucleotide-binding universal stress UspA family protein
MQLAGGALDAQLKADMEIQGPVERKLQSANLLVTSEIMAGSPATDVIESARRWRADCVFIGAEEMSFIERFFCGDFVASVASRAECSVEVVRRPVHGDTINSELSIGDRHKDSLPVAG